MKQIILDAIDYLKIASEDDSWKRFSSLSVTELIIPKTSKEIKKYVLKQRKPLLSSNSKMILKGVPNASKIINVLDDNIINSYQEYFNNEKKALILIKKILNSKKKTFDGNIPKCSSCGIILNSLYLFHLENQERLTLAVKYCGSIHKGYNVYMDNQRITATGNEFVKELNKKLNKQQKNTSKKY